MSVKHKVIAQKHLLAGMRVERNILKNSSQKFGHIEKLFSSLHPEFKNMLRIQLHIESLNGISLRTGYTNSGACYVQK
jgi:hypothetical protein